MTQVRGLVQCLVQAKPSVGSRAFMTLPLSQNPLGEGWVGSAVGRGAGWGKVSSGFWDCSGGTKGSEEKAEHFSSGKTMGVFLLPERSLMFGCSSPLSPQGKISDPFRFTTFYIYFTLVLFALVLSCFREKPPLFSPKNVDPVSFPWRLGGSGGSTLTPQQPAAAPMPSSFFHLQVITTVCNLGLGAGRCGGLLPLICLERVVGTPDLSPPTLTF